jgi:hypothetical protein
MSPWGQAETPRPDLGHPVDAGDDRFSRPRSRPNAGSDQPLHKGARMFESVRHQPRFRGDAAGTVAEDA